MFEAFGGHDEEMLHIHQDSFTKGTEFQSFVKEFFFQGGSISAQSPYAS